MPKPFCFRLFFCNLQKHHLCIINSSPKTHAVASRLQLFICLRTFTSFLIRNTKYRSARLGYRLNAKVTHPHKIGRSFVDKTVTNPAARNGTVHVAQSVLMTCSPQVLTVMNHLKAALRLRQIRSADASIQNPAGLTNETGKESKPCFWAQYLPR